MIERQGILTEELLIAALHGEWTELCALPKSDLHSHAMLAAPRKSYERRFAMSQTPVPARFSSPKHFFRFIRENYFPHFTSLVACTTTLTDMLLQHRDDSIVRAEVSFDAVIARVCNVPWTDVCDAFSAEIQRAGSKGLSPELGIAREGFDLLGEGEVLSALDTGFFDGIDIYGDEAHEFPSGLRELVEEARRRKLRVKLHSGEHSDAALVRRDVELHRPDAIQHGIAAASDSDVLAVLAESKVPVHVCPFSNYMLSVVESYERHPIRRMFDAGVHVTINTDDFGVFGRTLSEEYVRLFESGLFSANELEQIRRNGLYLDTQTR